MGPGIDYGDPWGLGKNLPKARNRDVGDVRHLGWQQRGA